MDLQALTEAPLDNSDIREEERDINHVAKDLYKFILKKSSQDYTSRSQKRGSRRYTFRG